MDVYGQHDNITYITASPNWWQDTTLDDGVLLLRLEFNLVKQCKTKKTHITITQPPLCSRGLCRPQTAAGAMEWCRAALRCWELSEAQAGGEGESSLVAWGGNANWGRRLSALRADTAQPRTRLHPVWHLISWPTCSQDREGI